ncbi:MAG: SurA N-terminal domain-containing protein [Candidatus Rokubacteria bacterium]|nr:SurA N-terminal domain-containing protein [Candidatus Rokubacteria bacterium]
MMISAMRRYLKSLHLLLGIVIVAFIGTTFLVWGKGSITGSDVTAPATVNGEDISQERYQRRYQEFVEYYRQLFRDRFTDEQAQRMGLSQLVLNDLIDETLVAQWVAAEGLTVSDEELRARIQGMRAFQQGGRFSRDRYLRVLKENRREPAGFEADLRRALARRKAEETIRAGIKVSEAELRQAYELRREKVRAVWVLVETAPFLAKVAASDDEIQAYLKDHPAEFQRPERRRVQYVVVAPKAFPQKVSDAEVEAYYKDRGREFERPHRVRAAHVLVQVPEVGGSEAEQKSRARVEEVIRRAKAGEDFAKLAKEISEDPASAGSGGDIGFVSRGDLVPAFEQAVFALKKGEVSPEPVRTPFGYHAIKVLDIQEADKRPLKEVAAQITEKLQAERSDRAAVAKADEAASALRTVKDFADEARKLGLEPKEATLARGVALEGVGRDAELEETVFSVAAGGTSGPLKTAAGYVLLKGVEHLPAAVPPLGEIKEQVALAVKRPKAEAQVLERAKALGLAAARGEDFVALAAKEGSPTGDTGLVSQSDPPKDPKLPREVLRLAFQTGVGKISEPAKTPQGMYLVKTLERHPPDPSGFDKERGELEKQLLELKQADAWQSWVATLRAKAKIQVQAQLQ